MLRMDMTFKDVLALFRDHHARMTGLIAALDVVFGFDGIEIVQRDNLAGKTIPINVINPFLATSAGGRFIDRHLYVVSVCQGDRQQE